ncbi:MAG: tyrosine-type recombinase/integrase [Planctomycetia bacterium]|nr:tyrosine-type recombinase/integrase [Planctomycetia bacterium]
MEKTKYRKLGDLLAEHLELVNLRPEVAAALIRSLTEPKEKNGLSDEMTLTEFYTAYYKPNVSVANDRDKNTMEQRERALRYWAEATGDPALRDIDTATLTQFVTWYRSRTSNRRRPHSPASIRKDCMALASILTMAGPKQFGSKIPPEYRNAAELIPAPPAFPKIRVAKDVSPKTPRLRELEAILRNCDAAQGPRFDGCEPGTWWRALYLFVYNTGVRRGDILQVGRWEHVQDWDGQNVYVISSRTEKEKMEKIIPLTKHAMEALYMLPCNHPHDYIFPFPWCETTYRRWQCQILDAAGIPYQRGGLHAIRRLVGTTCPNAQKVLGHTTAETTRLHYQSIATVESSLETLRQPEF